MSSINLLDLVSRQETRQPMNGLCQSWKKEGSSFELATRPVTTQNPDLTTVCEALRRPLNKYKMFYSKVHILGCVLRELPPSCFFSRDFCVLVYLTHPPCLIFCTLTNTHAAFCSINPTVGSALSVIPLRLHFPLSPISLLRSFFFAMNPQYEPINPLLHA